MNDEYWRRAGLRRVVDGDTMDLQIDLGFHMQAAVRVRLLGVDTPEKNSSDPMERIRAAAAQQFAEAWFVLAAYDSGDREVAWPLLVQTTKTGKFGRWLARIVGPDQRELGIDLLEAGHAEVYR